MNATTPTPSNVPAMFKQAIAHHQQGNLPQAKALYEQVLRFQPRNHDALHLLGVIAGQTNDPQRAVELIGRAIQINPKVAGFYSNRGNALQDLKRFDEAVASYDKALALKADFAEVHYNRGIVLQELGRLAPALSSYQKAIAARPDYAEAYWNRALVLLLSGDFEKGWKEYEWRWKREKAYIEKRSFAQPLWLGKESLKDKTILLYSEQGLGDAIQFGRYARLVSDLGARVILEVKGPLLSITGTLDGVDTLVEKGTALPGFNYHCPLLSLPLAFKTNLDTIPATNRYLHSDPAKLVRWQAKLGEKKAPRVGLVWSGNARHINDGKRSVLLADLVGSLPTACEYVSLQKDIRDGDMQFLNSHPDLRHFGDELADFGDTAALCDLMDIVISVDTSVAHLSGALGRPTWILLPFSPDWRWLTDRDDTPWYQSARLYRQEKIGDWAGVYTRLNTDLADYVKLDCSGAA
ncbi:MAG: tetratricopeptide repeat protein [Gallionella sp.]